jgi:hypothetical protein
VSAGPAPVQEDVPGTVWVNINEIASAFGNERLDQWRKPVFEKYHMSTISLSFVLKVVERVMNFIADGSWAKHPDSFIRPRTVPIV